MLKNLFVLAAAAHLIGKAFDKRADAEASPSVGFSELPLNPALAPEWAARIGGG